MDASSTHYGNVLSAFNIEWEVYEAITSENDPKVPKIVDRDGDRRIICWAPIFMDSPDAIIGATGPLSYVLRDEPIVPLEGNNPLHQNAYYGDSGGLADELVSRLPHTGPIYNNDNAAVYQKTKEAARGTSVESTIKPFSRRKDGRGAFLALIANHAGDVKYRAIAKKRQNLPQTIKWIGNYYALETHVSNHRQAYDDLRECSTHITIPVPSDPQRVEYLINSITSKDSTLQVSIGLVSANTNNMRNGFEGAANILIEIDLYRRPTRTNTRDANVSAIDFSAGRGNTGVDLLFHPKHKFLELPQDQKDELTNWLSTNDGKKAKESFFSSKKNTNSGTTGDRKNKRKSDGNAGSN